MIHLSSLSGSIEFGRFRLAWQNQDDEFDGFTAISFGDHAIELGAVDQDLQGIYFTRYQDGEVLDTRPIWLLP
jgi:hypothetical protein